MAKQQPLVGVVLGSDSDLEQMRPCTDQLEALEVPYELRVISAHRTPDEAHEYASTASERGLKVIIAAAGMSAALGGVLAGKTTLPVIGVPVASGPLGGVDAAVSTLQMPPGVPVGCMSIGRAGAENAAIFAAQILATGDSRLSERLGRLKAEQSAKVCEADRSIRRED